MSSKTRRGHRVIVPVTVHDILDEEIAALSTERLGRRLGRISPEELEQVIEGLFELVA